MAASKSRNESRKIRQKRGRRKIKGTATCPRLCVYRSLTTIYAQLVDDETGHTLLGMSTASPELQGELESRRTIEAAGALGKAVAEKAKTQGIETVVFDRSGYKYHGRVKALAEAAREAGLRF